ncbi:hypothetical protein CJ030_MR4G023096 [Morella rubra]|uniref:AAA+ ATPase At3g28540-like C-terminal domain-containing protein n=1 Tax=Morella rubra TaxID=262757 RepID=A0A6A1VU91_9ROSI|nr:hypothetical protein CJ030_MR4G023096 [Morella rubra]
MNFTTLAMDSELKVELMNDLDRFVNGKELYRRTGKAWKRGILIALKLPNRGSENKSGNNHRNKEQIIVFTTNDKHSLEPALLRPGRMDMHVHMAYCTISAFKQLAINYHGISYHHLYGEIEGLITEVKGDPLKKLQETY